MILVLVESPTKAKAINEYLKGDAENYNVLSTYGHIRDIVPKAGSIDVANDFSFKWEMTPQWAKHKAEILKNAKAAEKIILATDLDREGEGISWHLNQVLLENKIKKPTERIIFHSVSKEAIKEALKNKQQLRNGLIEAYLSRLGLDYLFGFSVSPILWRKVPGCKSAGRVQSVALRLIVEREYEIKIFKSEEYITIHAKFKESAQEALLIKLGPINYESGRIFKDFPEIKILKKGKFEVAEIKKQKTIQKPPAPFITSTLQQEASSKLNFPPSLTMQLAQKLYEGFQINGKHTGLITYMRTDNTSISKDAINAIREKIAKDHGKEFLPETPHIHKQKVRNAQEAHEAIRPVDINLSPERVNLGDANLEKLYKLIWERSIVSQMKEAIVERTNILISGPESAFYELKGQITLFKGFKKMLPEEKEEITFNLQKGDSLNLEDLFKKEHETQAPGRFSEAGLIQQLEKRGIGRPSTYARIIHILYEREYVTKEKKNLVPTQKGWIVVAFLKKFFNSYVAYEFTADLETKLDELSQSEKQHTEILQDFWGNLDDNIKTISDIKIQAVADNIQNEFEEYFSPGENKKCPECSADVNLKITKFGIMFGCSRYPECKGRIILNATKKRESSVLGYIENAQVHLKDGPYGPYFEFGFEKSKRVPIPKMWANDLDALNMDHAIFLNELPKNIGNHKDGNPISVGIGRFGPFIKHLDKFISIKDPMQIDLEAASALIEEKEKPGKQKTPKKKTTKASKTTKKQK